jgi:hypothetical protein
MTNTQVMKALQANGFTVYLHGDRIHISGETGDHRVNYYTNYWTPELDAVLFPMGKFAEWLNAGELVVCQA